MLLIAFTTEVMDGILGWTTEIVGDFLPLIVVILGIGIGIWILEKVIFHRH